MFNEEIFTTVVQDKIPYLLEIDIKLKEYPNITGIYSEIMTERECEEMFENWLDSCDELWKMAVENDNTTLGLDEFIEDIRDKGFLEHLNVTETNVYYNDERVYKYWCGEGSCHDMIEKAIPQLKPLTNMHLGNFWNHTEHLNTYLGKRCFDVPMNTIFLSMTQYILNNIKLPDTTENEAICKLLKYKICRDGCNWEEQEIKVDVFVEATEDRGGHYIQKKVKV